MITAKAFGGKHYAVYGLARSGIATVEALLASGARVTAWDDRLLPGEGPGGDHLSLRVESPASARMKLTIQKRMTTVGSDQPRCSKW